ncbi:MAG: 2,4-diaminopentanoate dehydrogenase [Bacillota bacterium]
MGKIKVAVQGLGAMGSGMAELILKKRDLKLSALIDSDTAKTGKTAEEILEVEEKYFNEIEKLKVKCSLDEIEEKPDIVLIATASYIEEVFPEIKRAVEKGINVITIAEEMAYAYAGNKELAEEIDNMAVNNNVTVLGTGINPGFILDTVILLLSGAVKSVKKIEAARINDLSPFGPTVMSTQGVGKTEKEFKAGLKDGSIVGHIGFKESISLIAEKLGWKLDDIKEERKPIIAKKERKSKYITVKKGMAAGCSHTAVGIVDGKEKIVLRHPQQIEPEKEDIKTGDYIKIDGDPAINLEIKPEISGGKGTQAAAVNMTVNVFNAAPGLKTMADLPLIHCLAEKDI